MAASAASSTREVLPRRRTDHCSTSLRRQNRAPWHWAQRELCCSPPGTSHETGKSDSRSSGLPCFIQSVIRTPSLALPCLSHLQNTQLRASDGFCSPTFSFIRKARDGRTGARFPEIANAQFCGQQYFDVAVVEKAIHAAAVAWRVMTLSVERHPGRAWRRGDTARSNRDCDGDPRR